METDLPWSSPSAAEPAPWPAPSVASPAFAGKTQYALKLWQQVKGPNDGDSPRGHLMNKELRRLEYLHVQMIVDQTLPREPQVEFSLQSQRLDLTAV